MSRASLLTRSLSSSPSSLASTSLLPPSPAFALASFSPRLSSSMVASNRDTLTSSLSVRPASLVSVPRSLERVADLAPAPSPPSSSRSLAYRPRRLRQVDHHRPPHLQVRWYRQAYHREVVRAPLARRSSLLGRARPDFASPPSYSEKEAAELGKGASPTLLYHIFLFDPARPAAADRLGA